MYDKGKQAYIDVPVYSLMYFPVGFSHPGLKNSLL